MLGCESQGTRPPFPVEKVLVDMPSQPSVAVRCPEVEVTHTRTHPTHRPLPSRKRFAYLFPVAMTELCSLAAFSFSFTLEDILAIA